MAMRSIRPVKLKIYSSRRAVADLYLLASLAATLQILSRYSQPNIATENISKAKKRWP